MTNIADMFRGSALGKLGGKGNELSKSIDASRHNKNKSMF